MLKWHSSCSKSL